MMSTTSTADNFAQTTVWNKLHRLLAMANKLLMIAPAIEGRTHHFKAKTQNFTPPTSSLSFIMKDYVDVTHKKNFGLGKIDSFALRIIDEISHTASPKE